MLYSASCVSLLYVAFFIVSIAFGYKRCSSVIGGTFIQSMFFCACMGHTDIPIFVGLRHPFPASKRGR